MLSIEDTLRLNSTHASSRHGEMISPDFQLVKAGMAE